MVVLSTVVPPKVDRENQLAGLKLRQGEGTAAHVVIWQLVRWHPMDTAPPRHSTDLRLPAQDFFRSM